MTANEINSRLPDDCRLSERQMRELERLCAERPEERPARAAAGGPARTLYLLCLALANQAEENIAKWGHQDLATLALALAEEAGEVAQAVLKHAHEQGSLKRVREEAVDAGAVCVQIIMKAGT